MSAIKRSSPGSTEEKNPLANVELSDEDAQKLTAVQKDIARVELALGLSPFIDRGLTSLSLHRACRTDKTQGCF
jgi:hypothetical protein